MAPNARWRSPRSAPRSMSTTRASRGSRSRTASRTISVAATSRSTPSLSHSPAMEPPGRPSSPRRPLRWGGDLAHRILRTPLAPEISFGDDPLRMLRAARFIARFGLEPDAGLVNAVAASAERLEIVSAERIRDELDKLIVLDRPVRRPVVLRRHWSRRALPARTAGAAARARPDSPPQGRAQPHHRRGRERSSTRPRR